MGKAASSWYETGFEGAEDEAAKQAMGWPPDRWWMREGETKEIVFIDDNPFCCHVHSWMTHEKKWFHETCLSKISDDGCPADGAKGVGRADYTGHLTVIDVTGYTNDEGKEFKYQLKAFPGKTKVLNKLKKKKENKGSLLGQLWTLTRADKNTPNTGDDLDHVREIDAAKLLKYVTYKGKSLKDMIEKANGNGSDAVRTREFMAHHFQIPEEGEIPLAIPLLNYPNLYAPKDANTLRAMVANAKPFNSGGGSGSGTSSSSSTSGEVDF